MSINRRKFFKIGGAAIVAMPIFHRLLGLSGAMAADADLPMAKDSEEPAKTLKFCPNADKTSKNCAARKDKAKAGQYCYNCQLFTKLEGEKKAAKGKCMIMPANRVPGAGWCQSWVKNPAVVE